MAGDEVYRDAEGTFLVFGVLLAVHFTLGVFLSLGLAFLEQNAPAGDGGRAAYLALWSTWYLLWLPVTWITSRFELAWGTILLLQFATSVLWAAAGAWAWRVYRRRASSRE